MTRILRRFRRISRRRYDTGIAVAYASPPAAIAFGT